MSAAGRLILQGRPNAKKEIINFCLSWKRIGMSAFLKLTE
jgi:hypothetical protein